MKLTTVIFIVSSFHRIVDNLKQKQIQRSKSEVVGCCTSLFYNYSSNCFVVDVFIVVVNVVVVVAVTLHVVGLAVVLNCTVVLTYDVDVIVFLLVAVAVQVVDNFVNVSDAVVVVVVAAVNAHIIFKHGSSFKEIVKKFMQYFVLHCFDTFF